MDGADTRHRNDDRLGILDTLLHVALAGVRHRRPHGAGHRRVRFRRVAVEGNRQGRTASDADPARHAAPGIDHCQ